MTLGRLFQPPEGNGQEIFSRKVRRLGALWVVGAIVFNTAASFFVRSPDGYVFVFVYLACGAFTTPALVATWYTAHRHTEPRDRLGAMLAFAGLVTVFCIGLGMLLGLVAPWRWGNAVGVPAVALAGLLHVAGWVIWTRPRSGGRALLVDAVDALTSVLAVTAPLVVLWGPAVTGAEASWFTMPAAVATVGAIAVAYWTVVLFVRLGPGRGPFETGGVVLVSVGVVNAVLQTTQAVSGFTLPAPPLIALNSVSFSAYLLLPLSAPVLFRPGMALLPPQSQVRGARLTTVVTLTGLAILWLATLAVADARPWAVPFSFAVVSLLLVLVGIRQMATAQETRRLYRQVEDAFDERRRLLSQLMEHSVDDRRRFAGQLYAQAVAAYASFSLMADSGVVRTISPSAAAKVSARVGGDFARQAKSVQELALALRPLEGGHDQREQLRIPIQAYLASIYGNLKRPQLTVDIDDSSELSPDWMTETILLQIVQGALHNVWQHSQATTVEVAIHVTGERVVLRVTDDGTGFDPSAVPEGSDIATMRAAAAVCEGTLVIESQPGRGTTVLAHLGPERPSDRHQGASSPPTLRVVTDS